MTGLDSGALAGVLVLGAVHGVNPGMGWLFAVALGLQEKRARAVWRALGPLALGHAAAIALALAAAVVLGQLLPLSAVRWAVGLLLLGLGLRRLLGSHVHGRLAGLRVNRRQLAGWSFLMASGHGAGLMVVPLLLPGSGLSAGPAGHGAHAVHTAHAAHAQVLQAGLARPPADALLATLLHSAGYLLVTALVALVVYHRLGLRLLRTAWINLDAIWTGALVLTAALTLLA